MIVSELLLGDPAATLINKHASHVFSKASNLVMRYRNTNAKFQIMELNWDAPAPPIFE